MTEGQELEMLQALLAEYLKQYIAALTAGKQEFFLSICDIEDEVQACIHQPLGDYEMLLVNKDDYSDAVKVRNDKNVSRIVLLSGEGVKQIDSLKDFNEYSILCGEKQLRWECIQQVFGVRLKKEITSFLDVILEEGEVTFWEFFCYLYECIGNGDIKPGKFNRRLSMLRIWNSKETKILTKGKIRRLIRNSKEALVERRLTKAVMGNTDIESKYKKYISNALAKGDIQVILKKFYFEDLEQYLRGTAKSNDMEATTEDAKEEERIYRCSYEYMICEQLADTVEEIEDSWQQEENEDELVPELAWKLYYSIGEEGMFEKQMELLEREIRKMNIPEEKADQFLQKLLDFKNTYEQSHREIMSLTPVCLKSFCEKALGYTSTYFELLSFVLTDEMVRKGLLNSGIASRLQCLLCDVSETKIRMPFYHPISVLYYIAQKNMYEHILKQEEKPEITEVVRQTLLALVGKVGMQFPIEFMTWDGGLYALDYSSIRNRGVVEFTNAKSEVVYSALDFRVIYNQIKDYVARHGIATQITIALVEISDLNGLPRLVDCIRQMAGTENYNIGRVDFLILSAREEELKRQLSQMWDVIGTDDLIRFRFGRNRFYGEKGYDMGAIVAAADMTIIADCSTLYYAPRMEKQKNGVNALRNRLVDMDIQEQTAHYFEYGYSDIGILWDTLQHAEESRDEGFWYWKSKEINNNVLAYVNQAVEEEPERTIVALSSNDGVLNDIHKGRYIQAHRCKYNGKSITILNFDMRNRLKSLPMSGTASVRYSLTEFYDASLDIPNVHSYISEEIADILMEISLKDGNFCSLCTACTEDGELEGEEWQTRCDEWLRWQFETFTKEKNILSIYFASLWLNQWNERVKSITAALMVRRLYGGGRIETHYNQQDGNTWGMDMSPEDDCLEVVKIQEIFDFLRRKPAIDRQTVREFQDKYEVEMLERIIDCDSENHILEQSYREMLDKIQQMIKGE